MSLREDIISLRRQKLSIKAIAKRLGCSKSTASIHCHGVIDRLPQPRGISVSRGLKEKWRLRVVAAQNEAIANWPTVRLDPNLMGLLGLYWGEGHKPSKRGGTDSIGITNNDPILISAVFAVLRPLTKVSMRADVIIYPLHNKNKCVEFWSGLLPGVRIEIRPNTDIRSKSKWSDRCPYGRCRLRFSDFQLFWKIMTWLDCWRKETMALKCYGSTPLCQGGGVGFNSP